MFVNVTIWLASMVLVAGESVIVGSELTVMTELDECAVDPRWSRTVSNTLYVPAVGNLMVLPTITLSDADEV